MKDRISIEVLVQKRLREIIFKRPKGGIIPFPDVFARICPIFCFTKEEAWAVLRSMDKKGLIEIVPFHGIRIKNKIVNENLAYKQ